MIKLGKPQPLPLLRVLLANHRGAVTRIGKNIRKEDFDSKTLKYSNIQHVINHTIKEYLSSLFGFHLDPKMKDFGSNTVRPFKLDKVIQDDNNCVELTGIAGEETFRRIALTVSRHFIDFSYMPKSIALGQAGIPSKKVTRLNEFDLQLIDMNARAIFNAKTPKNPKVGWTFVPRQLTFLEKEAVDLCVKELNELKKSLNERKFGRPHCRVPDALLLPLERHECHTEGNVFLIMRAPMSQTQFEKLLK